jgi:hypothetical protein
MDLLRDMVVDMIDFYYYFIVITWYLLFIIVYQSLGKKEGTYVPYQVYYSLYNNYSN